MPKASYSAFGRSRAAGPVRAPARGGDASDSAQTALDSAPHEHLRKSDNHCGVDHDTNGRIPDEALCNPHLVQPESPIGNRAGHSHRMAAHIADHDSDSLVPNMQRPESPLGGDDRLRKPAPALELTSRYFEDAPDPSSQPLAVVAGVGERPIRHSDRLQKAAPARALKDREYTYRGRRMSTHTSNGEADLKPESHLSSLLSGNSVLSAVNSRPSSRSSSRPPSPGLFQPSNRSGGQSGSIVSGYGERGALRGDEAVQRRLRRGKGSYSPHNVPDSENQLIYIFDSRHTDLPSHTDKMGHSETAFRDVVVGQRILSQLLGRKDKLRNVLPLMDSTCTGRITFEDFSQGLRSAGVILGDADRRSVWADAGGSLAPRDGISMSDRVPVGEVDIGNFLSRLEQGADSQNWAQKKMTESGYSHHMKSSLTKGLVVRDDVEQFDATGGGMHLRRGYARSQSPPQAASPAASTQAKRGTSPMRWSKNEEHYRDLIKQRKESIKSIFNAKAIKESESDSQGSALNFGEFKAGLRSAGVTLSDMDFETLWRRVDNDCLGVVKYDNIAKAFDLTDRRAEGEPGGSRALPHFQQAGPEAREAPLERESKEFASSLAAERIARALLGESPAPGHTSNCINHEGGRQHYVQHTQPKPKSGAGAKVWDVVKQTLARHPQHVPLNAEVLHKALTSAGALISKADSAELWLRARQAAGKRRAPAGADPGPTADDLQAVLRTAAQVQTPVNETALLSYGSRVAAAATIGPPAPAADGARDGQEVDKVSRVESLAADALDRLASGFLGNPHRLRQVFKKFDLDYQGTVSRKEFEKGLLEQWTTLSHDDVVRLGAAVQDQQGVVDYGHFCKLVSGHASARGKTASFQRTPSKTDPITHFAYTNDMSYVGQYAKSSPRGLPEGKGRLVESPRGTLGQDSPRFVRKESPRRQAGVGEAGGRASSVQRERSTASIRSSASNMSVSSLGGGGPSDRSTWMHDKSQQRGDSPLRGLRAASPAPSASCAVGASTSTLASPAAQQQRASSPSVHTSAARNVTFGSHSGAVADCSSNKDPAAFRILHLAAGPPLAILRPRALPVAVA